MIARQKYLLVNMIIRKEIMVKIRKEIKLGWQEGNKI